MLELLADQASGLRRMMSGQSTRYVAVLADDDIPHGFALHKNLAAAFALNGCQTLLVESHKNQSMEGVGDTQPSVRPAVGGYGAMMAPWAERNGYATTRLAPAGELVSSMDIKKESQEFDVVVSRITSSSLEHCMRSGLVDGDVIIVTRAEAGQEHQAYRHLKSLFNVLGRRHYWYLGVGDEIASRNLHIKVGMVAKHFLNLDLELAGHLPADDAWVRSASARRHVVELFPDAHSAAAIKRITGRFSSKRIKI